MRQLSGENLFPFPSFSPFLPSSCFVITVASSCFVLWDRPSARPVDQSERKWRAKELVPRTDREGTESKHERGVPSPNADMRSHGHEVQPKALGQNGWRLAPKGGDPKTQMAKSMYCGQTSWAKNPTKSCAAELGHIAQAHRKSGRWRGRSHPSGA